MNDLTSGNGLLHGLKVVEVSEGIAGPYCARLLADLGADVIKVEPPGGDEARRAGPFPGDVPHPEKSGLFLALNTGKRGVTVDAERPDERERLLSLIDTADVVIANPHPNPLPEGEGIGVAPMAEGGDPEGPGPTLHEGEGIGVAPMAEGGDPEGPGPTLHEGEGIGVAPMAEGGDPDGPGPTLHEGGGIGAGSMPAFGLDFVDLRRRNPALVITAISPFGRTGPYRDFKGSDLVLFHMSGYAPIVPGAVQDIEKEPPLRAGGNQAEFVAGLSAATATMLALALRDDTGQGALVDVSGWEAMAMMPQAAYAEAGAGTPPRSRQRQETTMGAVVAILPTSDGFISISPREDHQWQAWLELMGRPGWAMEERFATRAARRQNWSRLEPRLMAWTRQQQKQDLYRRCQAAHVPAFPVNTAADLLDSEQFRARGFFQYLDHPVAGRLPYAGFPFKLSTGELRLERPAPRLGEHNAEVFGRAPPYFPRSGIQPERSHGATPQREANSDPARLPLAGLRVLDFSWIIAGPTCTRLLGVMGAHVIKVESRRRPDPSRAGGNHVFLNQSKRSLALNLSTPRGLEIARALAARSDVVVENYATGVIERLGLGYEALKAVRPDIIMMSGSGLGHTGPDRDHVAYGTLLQCFTGWSAQTGYPGGRPLIGGAWNDPLTGMLQTFIILSALRHRARTGEGMYVDLAMAEAMCTLLPESIMEFAMNGRVLAPNGNRDRRHAPHNVYRCRGDDAWVAIAVTSEDEWRALCRITGLPSLATDPRFATLEARRANEDALDALISAWTATLTPAEASERLQPHVPAGPSFTAHQALADPHLNHRAFFRECAGADGAILRLPGVPWRIEGAADPRVTPAADLGADSRAVLRDVLGLGNAQIEALEREQVLY